MALFVSRLETILRTRLSAEAVLPRVVASDRGPGFYQSSTGHIVARYLRDLKAHGCRPFAGEDASCQPPDIPDVLPHETVAGWVRAFVKKHPIQRSLDLNDNEAKVKGVMHDCIRHIRKEYDVESLCHSFRGRLQALVESKGDRLSH